MGNTTNYIWFFTVNFIILHVIGFLNKLKGLLMNFVDDLLLQITRCLKILARGSPVPLFLCTHRPWPQVKLFYNNSRKDL